MCFLRSCVSCAMCVACVRELTVRNSVIPLATQATHEFAGEVMLRDLPLINLLVSCELLMYSCVFPYASEVSVQPS